MTDNHSNSVVNPETFNPEKLQWYEPEQRPLPGIKIEGVTNQHRKLKQQLQRLLQESSFSVLLESLRELADDRSEWCAEFGYPGQQVPAAEAEFYDLLAMSIDRCVTRAKRWSL